MEQSQLHILKKKKKALPFFFLICKKSKHVLLCWDTSRAAGHWGDRWRVPPVSRRGFYEHSSQSLCTFTREHCHCFMWSSPVKIKYLCPKWLLRRRSFFDSVQLHSWCPQKFCEVNTSPQLGQQRHITIPVTGWLNFLPWVAERNHTWPWWCSEKQCLRLEFTLKIKK